MAKKKSVAPTSPSESEQLKWQAESVVREAIANTPAFKKAVRSTMKELKQVRKDAVKKLKGK